MHDNTHKPCFFFNCMTSDSVAYTLYYFCRLFNIVIFYIIFYLNQFGFKNSMF